MRQCVADTDEFVVGGEGQRQLGERHCIAARPGFFRLTLGVELRQRRLVADFEVAQHQFAGLHRAARIVRQKRVEFDLATSNARIEIGGADGSATVTAIDAHFTAAFDGRHAEHHRLATEEGSRNLG